jgi:hypothetical protein
MFRQTFEIGITHSVAKDVGADAFCARSNCNSLDITAFLPQSSCILDSNGKSIGVTRWRKLIPGTVEGYHTWFTQGSDSLCPNETGAESSFACVLDGLGQVNGRAEVVYTDSMTGQPISIELDNYEPCLPEGANHYWLTNGIDGGLWANEQGNLGNQREDQSNKAADLP